jgi:DNA-binding NtrC family response regulator
VSGPRRLASALTVLVVEDEPAVRMLAADALMDAGYTVLEAANAAEATEILRLDGPVEAMFTDIHMPGRQSGLDLAHEVAAAWPSVALLLTSGRARPDPADLPQGAAFIAKPYPPAALVEALDAQLEREPARAAETTRKDVPAEQDEERRSEF